MIPIVQAEDVQRGRVLYNYCTACHGPAALGNPLYNAPALVGLPDWYLVSQLKKFRDGKRGKHPDDKHGLMMRPMLKTLYSRKDPKGDEAIASLAAYITTLEPETPTPTLTGGDPANGQLKYAVCVACHADKLQGNAALQSPPLRSLQDWYMLQQLEKFKTKVRFDPTDPQSVQMQAMTATLATEKDMLDVVAYITKVAAETEPPPPSPPPPAPTESESDNSTDASKDKDETGNETDKKAEDSDESAKP